jgi:hypothetical protein
MNVSKNFVNTMKKNASKFYEDLSIMNNKNEVFNDAYDEVFNKKLND